MITRNCSVVAVIALLAFSSGCSGIKSCLFGRGARCGLCTKLSSAIPRPRCGQALTAPFGRAPCAATPNYGVAPPYAAQPNYATPPAYQSIPRQGGMQTGPPAGCGCNGYAAAPCSPGCPGPGAYAGPTCGDAYSAYPYAGDCGCDPHGATDPYLSGEVSGGQSYPGTQYPSTQYPSAPGMIQSDDFSARRFDSDGDRIIWEEPIPPGSQSM